MGEGKWEGGPIFGNSFFLGWGGVKAVVFEWGAREIE